jgi:pimeloyl-ACP methyl ester carboxylesterase
MTAMSGSRRSRKLAIAGAALAAAGIAGAVAVRRRRDRTAIDAPWPELPEGRPVVVPSQGGAHLAVSVAGPPGAPTVVLAHCWMGLRRFWAAVAEQLVEDGHQVVVYDQRGHGESTLGDGIPAIADLGHDLRAVLDAVDARDVVLVGHSMGGMSIQSYATEHPDHFQARVAGVVLVATAARTLGRAVPAGLVELLMGERAAWRWQGALGRRMVRGAIGQRPQRTHIDLTLEGVTATAAAVRSGFLLAMAEMDLRDAGRTLSLVPTRVLVGTKDTLTPPRAARALADAISSAELEVIPGAGHMLPLEAPDRIVDAIRSVAAAREPAASSA